MSTSGYFYTTGFEEPGWPDCYEFSWELVSQSLTGNYSVISWKVQGHGGDTDERYLYVKQKYVTVDGVTKSNATQQKTTNLTVAFSGTSTIQHKEDGAGSFSASCGGAFYNFGNYNSTGSGTWSLPTIPRATTPDAISCSTPYFDGVITCKYTPKSAEYFSSIEICMDVDGEMLTVKTRLLGSKTAVQQTEAVTLTAQELAVVYEALPNTAEGTLQFDFRTFYDSDYSEQVGDDQSIQILLQIPRNADTLPDPGMTLTAVSTLPAQFDGLFIQGKTKLSADFQGEGKYGSRITGYSLAVEGKTYAEPYVTDFLTKYGSVPVTGTATDSRGFPGSMTQNITVIPYSKPMINVPVCGRCDKNGDLSDSGTYLLIQAIRSYHKVISDGEQKNFCAIQYRYCPESGDFGQWETVLAPEDLESDEVITGAMLDGMLSAKQSYLVQIRAVDDTGEYAITTVSIPTDKVYMHRDGARRSIAFGKYVSEPNTVDVAEDITAVFRGDVRFEGENWMEIGLSDEVTEPTEMIGRMGTGCYYRVLAGGKHICVAFACGLSYTGEPVTVNSDPIPEEYRPGARVYGLCAADGVCVAQVAVTEDGYITLEWVQNLLSVTRTQMRNVKWIDGYIEFWI